MHLPRHCDNIRSTSNYSRASSSTNDLEGHAGLRLVSYSCTLTTRFATRRMDLQSEWRSGLRSWEDKDCRTAVELQNTRSLGMDIADTLRDGLAALRLVHMPLKILKNDHDPTAAGAHVSETCQGVIQCRLSVVVGSVDRLKSSHPL
jgi:hypothetical protein